MKKFFLKSSSPTTLINQAWRTFKKVPYGNWIFSKIIGRIIPYTGSISSIVEKIDKGAVVVRLRDKKVIRNHLNSIHAIALANLGEFTTGLSVISQLTEQAKAILVKIEVEYFKKARGELIAEALSVVPENITQDMDLAVAAQVKNLQNELVCQITATWRIRP